MGPWVVPWVRLFGAGFGSLFAELAFGLEPVLQLASGFASASEIDFVGTPRDLFARRKTVSVGRGPGSAFCSPWLPYPFRFIGL